jgi:hypothetical protein
MRVTTDLGDWTDIPMRVRLALIAIVVCGIGTGLAVAGGMIPLVAGALVIVNGGLLGQWAFSRRHPWWPPEPSWPVDPVDRNFGRRLVFTLALDGMAAALIASGIVRL